MESSDGLTSCKVLYPEGLVLKKSACKNNEEA